MIGRRSLVSAGAAVALTAGSVRAQSNPGLRRIAVVGGEAAHAVDLRDGLRGLGWVEGRNLTLLHHPTTAPIAIIDELLALPVEILCTSGPARIRHAMSRTKTIPIVGFDLESDPVAAGFVASLAQPGGNVTGIWQDFPALAGKLVQMMQEVLPELTRLTVLWVDPFGLPQLEATRAASVKLGIELTATAIADAASVVRAIDGAVARSAQALLVLTAPTIFVMRQLIAEQARRARLPSISPFPAYASSGGLIGYGANLNAMYRQAAPFIDKILHGRPPGQIPIERPARFGLIVNSKTARELNIAIPGVMLGAADEVIE